MSEAGMVDVSDPVDKIIVQIFQRAVEKRKQHYLIEAKYDAHSRALVFKTTMGETSISERERKLNQTNKQLVGLVLDRVGRLRRKYAAENWK